MFLFPSPLFVATFSAGEDCNGVQAPVLWRVPFFAPALRMWDASEPQFVRGEKSGCIFFTFLSVLKGIS